MARECAICGKGKMVGSTTKFLRAHTNITGKRTFKPNLQKVTRDGQRILACVSCIRDLTKSARATAQA
ncbi:MAG: L28 family ribosomal protein [Patescibacteria group bacterium]